MSTMPLQLHNCPVCGKYIWHGGYEDRVASAGVWSSYRASAPVDVTLDCVVPVSHGPSHRQP